jgi:hypothetical protein
MIVNSSDLPQVDISRPIVNRVEDWHLWTVLIPRRTITGRLVRGKVWRRRDGRHWIYKKYFEIVIVGSR